jgi:CheY-like chemotaxis protein
MARILIIDDNDELRAMLRKMLEKTGHEVEEARNGNEGIRCFRRSKPDLIFCDLLMPDKEGLETIRELCREDPTARIVAMTGGGGGRRQDYLQIAINFGAIRSIEKPFGLDEIRTVLSELFGASSA